MHHIHHTHAIILGSKNTGEANKVLHLYTQELGFISAVVQGIRTERSKLRFALQDFSYAEIDLVRGKEMWRVTTAMPRESFVNAIRDRYIFNVFGQVGALVMRLCAGEEANERIFEDLLSGFRFFNQESLSDTSKQKAELGLVLRILHHLGYIGSTDTFAPYLDEAFDPNREIYAQLEKKTILFEINRALKESQL